EDALHFGNAALVPKHGEAACGDRDSCGGGRADGADRAAPRLAGAFRAARRDGGAASGRRADHGDRLHQDPAGHLLRCRRLDPARPGLDRGFRPRDTGGVFAVLEKEKDHHSTMYDDAWMPNMQRITWNGIALHGGPLPGYAASHGCIRMPYGFAE